MNATWDGFLRSWPYDPWLLVMLVATAGIYARGWLQLRRYHAQRWDVAKLAAFLGGLFCLFLALASPIEVFAALLLSVHMLQHMLLLIVVPLLIWYAAPLLPMMRGLPRAARWQVGAMLRSPATRDLTSFFTRPYVAWTLLVVTVWGWHTPRGYQLALADPTWHVVEHATFLAAALLFWWPVMQPYPHRATAPRWILLPYLLLADVQNTLLAAWLTFAGEPIYSHYAELPSVAGMTPLADQQLAGVLMWVPGSIAYLLPVSVLAWRMLTRPETPARAPTAAAQLLPGNVQPAKPLPGNALPIWVDVPAGAGARQAGARPGIDLLRVPLAGRILGSNGFRRLLQTGMLLAAALVIYDGLAGPQLAPANLAGVTPWIHWRGLVMFGLLIGGNFFCMACPFTLPRGLASRWIPARWHWPRVLRSKWLAVVLVALFLWSYEAFALWDSPWWTAWIAVGYFVAAFAIDSLFRGAAFCKYVCPIGQFNFVQSLLSPWQVAVRDAGVCATCTGKECIRGSEQAPGCAMQLFQPRKQGNLDCTFCLDCVRACPHENVGLLVSRPLVQLADTGRFRSGIGRFNRRVDLAALVLLLVFGAFANAAGMIAPVVAWQDRIAAAGGGIPQLAVVTGYYLLALVLLPALFIGGATGITRLVHGEPLLASATRFAWMFVPLGFAMWLAHYEFHFLTSYESIVPVSQRMALDFGLAAGLQPAWQRACCLEIPDWIVRFELLALDFGLLLSLVVGYQIARDADTPRRALARLAPWACVALLLFGLGVWIVLEPMQMRGTLPWGD